MQLLASLLLLVAAHSPFALACGDDHAHHDHGHSHALSKRASSAPIAPPSRPLVWGDFNVIHTTDSHGWLLGHQKASAPEPNYSGDFGDFASFVTHMKKLALVRPLLRFHKRQNVQIYILNRRRTLTYFSLTLATCMTGQVFLTGTLPEGSTRMT